ncbi:SHOCT domain-containing protein [Microbacterium sp. B2969]|uniref:SHOCT domain-containing protein n=1 Tax=Microbacterium alkaliflavum TaxID=3248839 RepID=A0ABW7QA09_9MICO
MFDGSFWNIVLWFFWVFAFVAYLFVLITIFSDLFRDHKLSGWWKAVWVIFLIFLPFLTALIYLIARGSGMQERALAEAKKQQEATAAYIQSVAASQGGGASAADEIAKAADLLKAGTITQAEYDQLKARALA